MLTPEQQTALNDVYWNSKRSVADIRREFDLTESELNRQLTPRPTGESCWFCHEPLTYRSRRDRNDAQRIYGHLHCRCGARQPKLPPSLAGMELRPSDALIVVPLFDAERRGDWRWVGSRVHRLDPTRHVRSASDEACSAIEALAMVGLRWSGAFISIEQDADPHAVVAELEHSTTRTIVLPSVSRAMANEGDSLTLFFSLVQRGWRVISARDARLEHERERDGWHGDSQTWDGLATPWQRSSSAAAADAIAVGLPRTGHLRAVPLDSA